MTPSPAISTRWPAHRKPPDPSLSLKWLDRLLQHSLGQKITALVDLGGGDTTLRRLAVELPDLVALFEAQGFAVVLFHTVGPQEEDLSPLATLQGLGFKPTAAAIILNEAMIDVGETRDTAFARILRHSVVRHAIGEGAVPVFMPRLLAAQPVEIRRLKFHDAIAGKTGRGDTPLGPFDRARVRLWLEAMDTNFAGVSSWLPWNEPRDDLDLRRYSEILGREIAQMQDELERLIQVSGLKNDPVLP